MWRCLVPVAMKSAKRSGLTRRRTGRLRPRAARLLPWMNGKLWTLEARSRPPRDLGPACNEGGWAAVCTVLLLTPVTVPSRGSSPWRCGGCSSWAAPTRSPLSPARSPLALALSGSPGCHLMCALAGPPPQATGSWPLATKAQLYTQCADCQWPHTGRPIRPALR
jgi:hypothetical protein